MPIVKIFSQNRLQNCLFLNPNDSIKQIAAHIDSNGLILFKKLPLNGVWNLNQRNTLDYLGFNTDISFRQDTIKQRISMDGEELKSIRYQQLYKGIPVECGILIEHWVSCLLDAINGKVLCDLNLNVNPTLNPTQSIQFALNHFNSSKYFWQDTVRENGLKEETGNPNATYFPTPQLLINCSKVLVYSMSISSSTPYFTYTVQVNANTGAIERIEDNELKCIKNNHESCEHEKNNLKANNILSEAHGKFSSVLGDSYTQGTTTYNGVQTLKTTSSWGKHRLIANYYNTKIETRDYDFGSDAFPWKHLIKHTINNGQNTWPASLDKVTGVHWAATKSMDYFNIKCGYYPSVNKLIKVAANGGSFSDTKFSFSDNRIDIDITPNVGYYGSLDVVGHEFTHMVSNEVAGMKGYNPLIESYSDIFGELVENFANGTNDWILGGDFGTIRNLQNPRAAGPASSGSPECGNSDPDTYLGPGWSTDYLCSGYVNTGVQNKWFYLLSEGGTHNGVNVSGIGIEKAAKIAFRTLEKYGHNDINYPEIAQEHTKSAEDLFGPCSNEHIMTKLAWIACGVNLHIACVNNRINRTICTDKRNLPISITAAKLLPNQNLIWKPIKVNIIFGNLILETDPTPWTFNVSSTATSSTLNITDLPFNPKPGTYYFQLIDDRGNVQYVSITLKDCKNIVGNPPANESNCNLFTELRNSEELESNSLESIEVFPIPSSNFIYVNGYKSTNLIKFEIFNSMGQKSKFGILNDHEIDISSLNSGSYILKLTHNEKSKNFVFIKI